MTSEAIRALRALIEAAAPDETTQDLVGGATTDITPDDLRDDSEGPEPLTPRHLQRSQLARSYLRRGWSKLRVFHQGHIWDVAPVIKGGQLVSFSFTQMKYVPAIDPIVPRNEDELDRLESRFDLDRGISGNNVTELK